MYRLNISYKRFYIILNEISLCESDPNPPVHAANLVANSGNTAYGVGVRGGLKYGGHFAVNAFSWQKMIVTLFQLVLLKLAVMNSIDNTSELVQIMWAFIPVQVTSRHIAD